jgi:hypothetical protein
MFRKRMTQAFDDGQAAALDDHGSGRFDGGPPRPRGRRGKAYDAGYRRAYDGSVRESRRAHRRLTGRD